VHIKKAYGGVEVSLLSYLTLALDGSHYLHTFFTYSRGKQLQVSTEKRAGWALQPVWMLHKDTNPLSLLDINPLNANLNPICHLLVLLGANPILYISRIRVKL
jgi:hypothetical protein